MSLRLAGRFGVALVIAVLGLAAAPERAEAADEPVTSTGKGIVGGALLGGEISTFTLGIIGVEEGWPYFAVGAAGAIGGGIGGFYIEDSGVDAEVPVYMLAGGMALLIPAVVVGLNATRYRPGDEGTDDDMTPAGAPPGSIQGGMTLGQAAPPPLSLVDVREGDLSVGMPLISVVPAYTTRELTTYGVEQHAEVRLPLLAASF